MAPCIRESYANFFRHLIVRLTNVRNPRIIAGFSPNNIIMKCACLYFAVLCRSVLHVGISTTVGHQTVLLLQCHSAAVSKRYFRREYHCIERNDKLNKVHGSFLLTASTRLRSIVLYFHKNVRSIFFVFELLQLGNSQ